MAPRRLVTTGDPFGKPDLFGARQERDAPDLIKVGGDIGIREGDRGDTLASVYPIGAVRDKRDRLHHGTAFAVLSTSSRPCERKTAMRRSTASSTTSESSPSVWAACASARPQAYMPASSPQPNRTGMKLFGFASQPSICSFTRSRWQWASSRQPHNSTSERPDATTCTGRERVQAPRPKCYAALTVLIV